MTISERLAGHSKRIQDNYQKLVANNPSLTLREVAELVSLGLAVKIIEDQEYYIAVTDKGVA